MTLVLSVQSRDSLWLVVDRRLSSGGQRPPIDDAVKVMNLETTDGVGLLAYAGLGRTPRGTQPSDWMGAVLRGRAGLTFEHALRILSDTANQELPKYLVQLPGGANSIVVPAFVQGVGAGLYTIENVVDSATGTHSYRYTRHVLPKPTSPSPRIATAGTGGLYLLKKDRAVWRALLSLTNRHDESKISDLVIADRLAAFNFEAHLGVSDGSVGPRCIVVWRRRPGVPSASGGGHQFYTGTVREDADTGFPVVANGMNVLGISRALMPQFQQWFADYRANPGTDPAVDKDEMNRLIAAVPHEPDEKLR